MTAQMFKAALKDLGMTQIRAAEVLRVRPTTVNRWARGTRKVPGPVAAALECLRERRALEAQLREQQQLILTSTTGSGGAANFIAALQQRRDNRPPKP